MKPARANVHTDKRSNRDRRKQPRFESTLPVLVKFSSDGTPINGAAIEIGPNGMRLLTGIPLAEATYVHLSFESASNQTYCEGRVVWTKKSTDPARFESGIDIQRWGGSVPGDTVLETIRDIKPKKDRRARNS